MVAQLAKPGNEIMQQLTPHAAHVLHMAVGISGEAGELLDLAKKLAIYGRTPVIADIIEELGDLEFYMEGLRQAYGITREEILVANVEKLGRRYPNYQYTNEAAIARADKNG